MRTGLLQLPSVILPTITVPADVAPPGELVAISLGVVIGLGCLGVVIIVACVLVIRAIKKSNTPKNDV